MQDIWRVFIYLSFIFILYDNCSLEPQSTLGDSQNLLLDDYAAHPNFPYMHTRYCRTFCACVTSRRRLVLLIYLLKKCKTVRRVFNYLGFILIFTTTVRSWEPQSTLGDSHKL